MTTFTGKYRGKVVNNIDPLMLGRLIVLVPAVSEFPLSWAMPCVPYGWVELVFNYPIWTGCFWGDGRRLNSLPTTKVIKTVVTEINDLLTSVSWVLTPAGPSSSTGRTGSPDHRHR
jgi:hypothetical protein